jgi:transcriptional regulator with XRE-family HTH domain
MQISQRPRRERPPLYGVRISRGLGLRETARLARIDPGHLWRFEQGEERLGLDSLVRLARVLGVNEIVRPLEPYTRGDD